MSLNLDIAVPHEVCSIEDSSARSVAKVRTIKVQPSKHSRIVSLTEPAGLAVEQYKLLRRRLCANHPHGGLLMVTSPNPGEGKTLTSINLAMCLADGGYRTCLVDLDMRAPFVATTLGYAVKEDGIDDVLAGNRTIKQAVRQISNHSLAVLPVRQSTDTPAGLLNAASLGPILNELRTMYQWVLLDLPPAVPTADVAEVVQHVDGALLVVRSRKTEKDALVSPLEILGSKLWGVVLNDTAVHGSSYYGYYGKQKKTI